MPHWKLLDELLLDGQAINQIVSIIKLQGEWVRRRALFLDVDPLIVELKLRMMSAEDLGQCFIRSWHPILMLQNLSPEKVREAMDYWNRLRPLSERMKGLPKVAMLAPGTLSFDDLIQLEALSEESFQKALTGLLHELRNALGRDERVDYWDFVYGENFAETVRKAYLLSFLISEGYVRVETKPLEDKVYLTAVESPLATQKGTLPRSLAIPIDATKWRARARASTNV